MVLFAVLSSACGTTKDISAVSPVTEPPASGIHVTAYPYNTGWQGIDLPVEIGRFDAPTTHGRSDETIVEIGYVRYPSAEGSQIPTVILTDRDSVAVLANIPASEILAKGDVIVFSGRAHGFSATVPPCPDQLAYPFDEPLDIESLTRATKSFAAACLEHLDTSNLRPSVYSPLQIAHDIGLFAQYLDLNQIDLIAIDSMTAVVSELTHQYPSLIRKVVLAFRDCDQADTGANMSSTPTINPPLTIMTGGPGNAEAMTVGALDIAFLQARSLRDNEQEALAAAITAAEGGSATDLARLVLETRNEINSLSGRQLLTGWQLVPCYTAGSSRNPLEDYARLWPQSALRTRLAKKRPGAAPAQLAFPHLTVTVGDNYWWLTSGPVIEFLVSDDHQEHN